VIPFVTLVSGGTACEPELWDKTPANRRSKAKRKHAK